MLARLLSSGANHDEVAKRNPNWTVYDWCAYWERDLRKISRREGWHESQLNAISRERDCGSGCKCKIFFAEAGGSRPAS